MCASINALDNGGPGASDRAGDAHAPDPGNGRNGLQSALDALRQAADRRKVDPICAAYQALRGQANGIGTEEVFRRIHDTLGETGQALIISAFSHRHCFMCTAGAVLCQSCEGAGKNDAGRLCMQCDGLGVCACDFCRGTGWADRETIPPDLRRIVLRRQRLHIRSELKTLSGILAELKVTDIPELPPDRKRTLAARMLRAQSRLADLSRLEEPDHTEKIASLGSAVAKIEEVLDLLRRTAR